MLEDLTPEEEKEHQEFIKESVANGSYFQDALDWYAFQYIKPVCERTMLFFVAIITGLTCYVLFLMTREALPLVQKVPVVIYAKDSSTYLPVIKKLKDAPDLRTVDEAVVKYLLIQYLRTREEYDFRDANIEDLNLKFNVIKNNSSADEYINFQNFMSEANAASPMNNFGKNVTRKIAIDSVTFPKAVSTGLMDRAKNFILFDLPSEVEIKYDAILSNNGTVTKQQFVTKISFKFSGVEQKSKKDDVPQKKLDFTVISYKTYK